MVFSGVTGSPWENISLVGCGSDAVIKWSSRVHERLPREVVEMVSKVDVSAVFCNLSLITRRGEYPEQWLKWSCRRVRALCVFSAGSSDL